MHRILVLQNFEPKFNAQSEKKEKFLRDLTDFHSKRMTEFRPNFITPFEANRLEINICLANLKLSEKHNFPTCQPAWRHLVAE